MKNLFLIILGFMVFALIFVSSCTKETFSKKAETMDHLESIERTNELTPEEYISSVYENLDLLTLNQIGSEPMEVQILLFNQISPAKRKSLILERLSLENSSFTAVQRTKLNQLYEFISSQANIYNEESDHENINDFIESWVDEAFIEYQFDSLSTLQLLTSFTPLNESITFWDYPDYVPGPDPDDSNKWCVCRRNMSCNFLTDFDFECIDYGCRSPWIGCGWLLLRSCWGRCH